ncbi:MAG: hypothetical protein NTY11_00625 [Candidatus Parcubacteria bacterium]|nr:hypothetical protein [Candidatus Parcubacteria bacterium]
MISATTGVELVKAEPDPLARVFQLAKVYPVLVGAAGRVTVVL